MIGLYYETAFKLNSMFAYVPLKAEQYVNISTPFSCSLWSINVLLSSIWPFNIESFVHVQTIRPTIAFKHLGASIILRKSLRRSTCQSSTAASILGNYFRSLGRIDVYNLHGHSSSRYLTANLVNHVSGVIVQHPVRILIGF
jgi:hypothetical protein